MKCPKCGKESEGAKFCPECGERLLPPESPPINNDVSNEEAQQKAPYNEFSNNTNFTVGQPPAHRTEHRPIAAWKIAVPIISAFILLCCIAWGISKSNETRAQNDRAALSQSEIEPAPRIYESFTYDSPTRFTESVYKDISYNSSLEEFVQKYDLPKDDIPLDSPVRIVLEDKEALYAYSLMFDNGILTGKSKVRIKATPTPKPTPSPTPKPTPTPTPTPEPTPEVTPQPTEAPTPEPKKETVSAGKKNALKMAKSYLDYTGFSYQGLIEQLEYEKFSNEEATYAADNCGADWNEQAARVAQSYLDYTAFSRDGLIDQLEYEGFTYDQAVYGVNAVGL